ncbi:uncharacterized protein MONOS_4300 [Monocercomonoides exilis]|uniref:uncharacterized protein n=1 Tax=Monocercomonoides exilis TaxID=2049356 RepID=UPI00355A2559|nr:hypothetical protein MONOS_4300 [Monocercomonoides exilis]|eukprot:MONOS_4300.1-p1 / transcript=MONOS_4300.1 / gene=MONOS_4300 / organism=Monocercomonoides_exilis_PA203 / gene_product=unspecified product / transcript_product=unspecified product / location=Mono_scaffold00112:96504-98386(+) / protein_length=370 / sequence_SO=supercontig / SO=protein_coding / is_pseudo=false
MKVSLVSIIITIIITHLSTPCSLILPPLLTDPKTTSPKERFLTLLTTSPSPLPAAPPSAPSPTAAAAMALSLPTPQPLALPTSSTRSFHYHSLSPALSLPPCLTRRSRGGGLLHTTAHSPRLICSLCRTQWTKGQTRLPSSSLTHASSFYPSLAGTAGLIGLSGVARQTQGALTVSSDTATITDAFTDNALTDTITEKNDEVKKELTKEKERERERERDTTLDNCFYLSANISLNRSRLRTVYDIPLSFSPQPGISTGIDVDVGVIPEGTNTAATANASANGTATGNGTLTRLWSSNSTNSLLHTGVIFKLSSSSSSSISAALELFLSRIQVAAATTVNPLREEEEEENGGSGREREWGRKRKRKRKVK